MTPHFEIVKEKHYSNLWLNHDQLPNIDNTFNIRTNFHQNYIALANTNQKYSEFALFLHCQRERESSLVDRLTLYVKRAGFRCWKLNVVLDENMIRWHICVSEYIYKEWRRRESGIDCAWGGQIHERFVWTAWHQIFTPPPLPLHRNIVP